MIHIQSDCVMLCSWHATGMRCIAKPPFINVNALLASETEEWSTLHRMNALCHCIANTNVRLRCEDSQYLLQFCCCSALCSKQVLGRVYAPSWRAKRVHQTATQSLNSKSLYKVGKSNLIDAKSLWKAIRLMLCMLVQFDKTLPKVDAVNPKV